MLDFFRGQYSWAKLERLISRLPARSRFEVAQADDEDFAEAVLALPESDRPDRGPSLADWSPEVNLLAAAVDRLGENIAATIAAAGGKAPKIRPLPRPKTAFDRVRARRRWEAHGTLVSEVEEAQRRWAAKRSG